MMKSKHCHNCETDFKGNYCFNCGQSNSANKRLVFSNLIKDFFDNTFNLHKGFFYTFWSLLIRPGQVSKSYIQGRRKTYTNPTRYLVIALAALATMNYWAQTNDVINNQYFEGYSFLSEELNNSMRIWDLKLLTDWTLLGNLLEALVFPFGFYWLFRKLSYNYSELLTFSFYLISNSIFIAILLAGLPKLIADYYAPVFFVFGAILLYYAYALLSFFNEIRLIKRILLVILGLVIFFILRFFLIPFVLAILFPI